MDCSLGSPPGSIDSFCVAKNARQRVVVVDAYMVEHPHSRICATWIECNAHDRVHAAVLRDCIHCISNRLVLK